MNFVTMLAERLPRLLPLTGMLWWPIPVLCGVGLLCLLIGFLRRR